jgi:hypothetical protein
MNSGRTSQSTTTLIAALIAAGSFVVAAFPAAAEQITAVANFTQCDQMKDPAKSAQCVYDTDIAHSKARIAYEEARGITIGVRLAAANAKISESDKLRACIAFLQAKKANGVTLAPERLNREKGCAYAAELGMK